MLSDLVNRSTPLPGHARLLVLGAGYSGRCLANLARSLGTSVLCTRRSMDRPDADLVFDSSAGLLPDSEALKEVTHLLSTIPPDQDGIDPVLSTLLPTLRGLPLQWVGYLSTTGVYGDRDGEWVSEDDTPDPILERSRRRLACEHSWQASGLPVQILRLPGIYGPGRSVLNGLRQGSARLIEKPGQVFCRIHVEDIAGACFHLIKRFAEGQRPAVVNVVDNCPAATADLLRYAAGLLQCSIPETFQFDAIQPTMSAMAQSFWSENRRVSNRLLIKDLGYNLLHPDYRAGLMDCLNQDSLTGDDRRTPVLRSASG